MNELTFEEVLQIHQATLTKHGGSAGIKDEGALRSAISQPLMAAYGTDLYPDFPAKGAALSFSLVKNHPFIDGNKRTELLALSVFLFKNGFTLEVNDDEAEQAILAVADSSWGRSDLANWIATHIMPTGEIR